MTASRMQVLAERLSSLQDSILIQPEGIPAPQEFVVLAEAALQGSNEFHPLVEPFDNGALVEILFIGNEDTHLVALAGAEGIVAAITTTDQGEADALYAGLAQELGILGEACEVCGVAIPSVYQVCIDCA